MRSRHATLGLGLLLAGAVFPQVEVGSISQMQPAAGAHKPAPATAAAADSVAAPWCAFVMPDTQNYVDDAAEAAVLTEAFDWVCANQATYVDWDGDACPIRVFLQLGDTVGTATESVEWTRIDAAFDKLDNCANGVIPYLVIPGNHDATIAGDSGTGLPDFIATFGEARFAPYACTETPCEDGKWFVGVSPDTPAERLTCTSTPATDDCPGDGTGPDSQQEGLSRAIEFQDGSGNRYLAIGTDCGGLQAEENPWVQGILEGRPQMPTILLQHDILDTTSSYPSGVPCGGDMSGANVRDAFLTPYASQIFLTLNGHRVVGQPNAFEVSVFSNFAGNFQTLSVGRNYQEIQQVPTSIDGWHNMAKFVPATREFSIRSIRITDASTGIEDYDYEGAELTQVYNWTRR